MAATHHMLLLAAIVVLHASSPAVITRAMPLGDWQHIDTESETIDVRHYAREAQDEYSTEYSRVTELVERVRNAQAANVGGFIDHIVCHTCDVTVGTLRHLVLENASEELLVKSAIGLCTVLKHFKSYLDDRVCHGIVREFKNEIIAIIRAVALSPKEVCGLLAGKHCGLAHNPWDESWTVALTNASGKPNFTIPKTPKQGAPQTVILHLSDVHTDPEYAPGSRVKCHEPLCCRAWLGTGSAGEYGSLGQCDSPPALVENLLQRVATAHKDIKYVIFTGDVPAHNVWNQTRSDILKPIATLSDLFEKYLPGVKVYPAVGNHESAPVDSFPPPYVKGYNNNEWLLGALAKDWSRWLPESTQATIKLGGFYAAELEPGLRLLSLNVNYCNPLNWWLLINDTDPAGQLAWMQNQLQDAENKNEKVYIIGHIPPRDGCLKAWSWTYHKIVNRYADTVRGQFFGHYHSDENAVFYDDEDGSAHAVGNWYIGPSVTTYQRNGVNPAYRLYQKDGDYEGSTHAVLDHHTYILNLTEVDATKKTDWKLEYSAREAFGMTALNPGDWNDLVTRMSTQDELLQKYSTYRGHSAGDSHCDASCRKSTLCSLRSTRAHDSTHCQNELVTGDDHQAYQIWQEELSKNC